MVPYVGEIRMFGGNFAPLGWAFCDGQILPISQYQLLYTLIGTTYGGDGQNTFALPDLRGRAPVHSASPDYPLGKLGGAEQITLTAQQFPAHNHAFSASAAPGTSNSPQNNVLATGQQIKLYARGAPDVSLHPSTLGDSTLNGQPYGTNSPQPHENMQPFLCVSFIIAVEGIYPSRD